MIDEYQSKRPKKVRLYCISCRKGSRREEYFATEGVRKWAKKKRAPCGKTESDEDPGRKKVQSADNGTQRGYARKRPI